METRERKNEFQTRVSSWYTDTMVKMQRLEEEKDELKKVIDEERSKHKEEGTDRMGLRRLLQSGSKDMMPNLFRNTAVSGSYKAWSREFRDYS